MRSIFLLVLLLAGAQAVRGETLEVVSPQADGISVTIYRDLFALITETRTVDLPEGPVTLSFEGVVETLLPESAVVTNLGRSLEERNFDYDALSPNNLLTKSIGKSVTITRTLPGAGKVVQTRAVIVSANEGGIVLRTEQGNEALHCSGLPERLTFDELPADLHARPKLSIRLAAGQPGKYTVRLSYLAHGFAWKADYVARLNAAGNRMDLTGWVTLQNYTQASFRGAQVQVVAGKLHLLDQEDGGTSLIGDSDDFAGNEDLNDAREEARQQLQEELEPEDSTLQLFSGCHAGPVPRDREDHKFDEGSSEVIVTGIRQSAMEMHSVQSAIAAVREELGDYQLYRLPWATDLNARQTKQAMFLVKPGVKIERFYSYFFDARDFVDEEDSLTPVSMIAFRNQKASGLGEPLPEGMMRMFETTGSGDVFAGEAHMADKPVDVPVELAVARALDLGLEISIGRPPAEVWQDASITKLNDVELHVLNAKGVPVTVEILQHDDAYTPGLAVQKSSERTFRKHGNFAWRLRVPANGTQVLTYQLVTPGIK